MSDRIDLGQIERKAYTSYHQDGIVDISLGLAALTTGAIVIFGPAWLGWISWLIATSLYAGLKRVFTIPRIGLVNFAPYRSKAVTAIATIVFSFTALLGGVAFMQTTSGGVPGWLRIVIENRMLVIGAAVALIFSAPGYVFRINRMYAYALLALAMFVVGHFLYYSLYYYIILLGTVILVFGLGMLIRFIRRYPLPATGSTGDSGNEKQ